MEWHFWNVFLASVCKLGIIEWHNVQLLLWSSFLQEICKTLTYFGRMGPSFQNSTLTITNAYTRFFSTLYAATKYSTCERRFHIVQIKELIWGVLAICMYGRQKCFSSNASNMQSFWTRSKRLIHYGKTILQYNSLNTI